MTRVSEVTGWPVRVTRKALADLFRAAKGNPNFYVTSGGSVITRKPPSTHVKSGKRHGAAKQQDFKPTGNTGLK